MGYRSQVGLRIEFLNIEDRKKCVELLSEEDQQQIALLQTDGGYPSLSETEKGFTLQCTDMKWYDDYPYVKALTNLVELAKELSGEDDDSKWIDSSGYFCRAGEEFGDIEEFAWHSSWDPEGLNGWNLGRAHVTITLEDE